MKTKFNGFLTLLLALAVQVTFAQEKTVTGKISDASGPLPGVTVLVKGTNTGTQSDFDGNYSVKAKVGDVIQFSFVGMNTVERTVGSSNTINVTMTESAEALEEVVVTALGITREARSIGYATQEVDGENVSTVKLDNVVNSLSGKVSGVQIRASNNFGGSANFLIRGVSSLTGNNQPLFVIDGVPISNRLNNTASQRGGSTGYDYGNAASDINPDDIESVNILKGAAASAVYGSRAANGVVIITTKKGSKGKTNVTVNSGITFGSIDKETFLEYQDEYGAGYGPYYGSTGYFEDIDVNGDGTDDLVVPTYDDASYGAPLDGSLVYQWDAFVPEHANYLTATPYVAGKTTPVDFFETTTTTINSVDFNGGSDIGSFRLGYTNYDTNGMLPNSKLNKNTINFNGILNVNEKLKVGTASNVVIQRTTGRNSTGYSDNLMSQFRQWWQVNVDMKDQQRIYEQTGKNYSWNHEGALGGSALQGHYWDNPYWTRHENYQTDNRTRFYGNIWGTYSINDWIDFTAKAAVDTYKELREERRAVGSVAAPFGVLRDDEASGFDRKDIDFTEFNYDFMLNFNKSLTDKLNLTGVVGMNIRREEYSFYHQATAGGLKVPGLYSLSNSVNSVPLPVETLQKKQVNGYYGQVSLGYDNLAYLEFTDRFDVSSSLPDGNNEYNYFALSSSLVFSSLIESDWLDFGKFRAGYAEVGNDLPANNVYDTYVVIDNFGSSALFSTPSTKNNANLKPERTKELEFGLEAKMLKNRIGLDFTWYKKNTVDQLMPVNVSTTTGYSSKWLNAGEIQNKGYEIGLNLIPVQNDNFEWSLNTNYSKNENEVISLFGDAQNLQLASYQGGISINATVGQPYGTIRGTGFVYYDTNGNGETDASEKTKSNRVINSSGYYISQADQIIGDANPDWNAGITNTLKYKDLTLSFLIDVQKGGDVYSLDMHYGQGTGLPSTTAGLNELGNPKRDPVTSGTDSGGVLNVGVTETGEVNTTRARADYYGGAFYWGNSSRNPAALTVYDASYIKLREISLKYNVPKKYLGDLFEGATLAFVGRNLWIIDKNVPYADPESGLGAGNAQGYLSGSYPTLKTYGFNVKLNF